MHIIHNGLRIPVAPESRDQLDAALRSEAPIEVSLERLSDAPLSVLRPLAAELRRRGNVLYLRADGSRLPDPLQAVDETSSTSEAIDQIITLAVVYHSTSEREQAIRECLRRVGLRTPARLSARCASEQRTIDSIGQTPVTLASILGVEAPVGDHVIPPGWAYDGSSVQRLEGQLRSGGSESLEGLPYIRESRVNADTGLHMIDFAWLYRGRTLRKVVPRATILTEKGAETLINSGFPLSQLKAGLLVDYCDAYFAANHLTEIQVVQRFGWTGTPLDSFIYGHDVMGNSLRRVTMDVGDPAVAELADALAPAGDESEAIAVLRELATFPMALFAAAAALASFVLAKVGVPGFVVDNLAIDQPIVRSQTLNGAAARTARPPFSHISKGRFVPISPTLYRALQRIANG